MKGIRSFLSDVLSFGKEASDIGEVRDPTFGSRPAHSGKPETRKRKSAVTKFSIIIPAYKTDQALLNSLLNSIQSQSLPPHEVIIVDDSGPETTVADRISKNQRKHPSLKIIKNERNLGISGATNVGLAKAAGEFVVFVDHDDELKADALARVDREIQKNPDVDVIYSDQITVDENDETLLHFLKPDWSPTYLLGCMYVGHLLVVRTSICKSLKIDSTYDGVQDFEFMLRVSETTSKITHVPEVLYKWRAVSGSLASASDAKDQISELQVAAVKEYLNRKKLSWAPESHESLPHRVTLRPSRRTNEPRISIVIPTKNQGEVLKRCLDSLFALTSYDNFEVVIVDNRTTDPIALEAIRTKNLKHIIYDEPNFNYSVANNLGIDASDGEFVLFLNNDTEIIDADWLRELVMFFEDETVGAVGSTLLYPDQSIQHAGIVLGLRGTADHIMRGYAPHVDGYAGSLAVAREVSAVTAACLIMRRSLFEEVGRFSTDYARHYQDVDLCLKILGKGKRIINSGLTRLIHHESVSRKMSGYDLGDRALLIDSWKHLIRSGDPYYNPGFDLSAQDYTPKPDRF